MFRSLLMTGAALAAATLLLPSALAQPAGGVEWTAKRGGTHKDSLNRLQLTLEHRRAANHSIWSQDYAFDQLPGLSPAQFAGGRQPARFVIARAAGRLDCDGEVLDGRGRGTCAFAPDPDFSALLQARGMGRPSWDQSLSLTLSRVDRPLVESLASIRSVRPTIDQLASMGVHGVTADLVRSVGRSGFPLRSLDDLVSLKIHGATPQWIEGIGRIGPSLLHHISGADLVSMRIHGVTPEWLGGMAAALGQRFASLSGSDLTSMRIHGAKPDMVAAFVRLIGGKLSGSDITSMAVHGVTADFIRRAAAAGHRGASASDIVSMRLHGLPARAASR